MQVRLLAARHLSHAHIFVLFAVVVFLCTFFGALERNSVEFVELRPFIYFSFVTYGYGCVCARQGTRALIDSL